MALLLSCSFPHGSHGAFVRYRTPHHPSKPPSADADVLGVNKTAKHLPLHPSDDFPDCLLKLSASSTCPVHSVVIQWPPQSSRVIAMKSWQRARPFMLFSLRLFRG
ncbi:hypothetical protein C8Q79DRAFT_779034 [Trametes meyenii]|nr:hypothetical protein C8Q79DRAFT_779034 [Trametes meyenii]